MSARRELLPLAFPVLLCVVAWGVILARPSARAHVVPQPRARVEAHRPLHRPPSPAPRTASEPAATEPAAVEAAAPEATSSTAAATDTSAVGEGLTIGISGESGGSYGYDFEYGEDNWTWSPSGLAWARRYFYYRRGAAERYRAWREARRRRQTGVLAPGSALAGAPEEDTPSLCEVFGAACGSSSSPRVVTSAPAAEPIPATVRRDGRRWTLANGLVEATIDPDALCAMAVRHLATRDGEMPPLTFATPSAASCEVTETAAPDTAADHGGVAVALTWRGNGWWQQAVVSLRDEGSSPEASITRTLRVGASVNTEVSNLTGSPLTWTVDGRDHTVSPRAVLHLRS